MAVTNNLKPQVDLPVWEWCRFTPTATVALSGMATADDGSARFIYYISASSFYRYDTYADAWQQLATPNTAPFAALSLRYTGFRGYHGRVLSAGATSVQIGGLRGATLNGKTIKILSGPGIGQERVLTFTGETIHDMGVITATTTLTLADSTKKWKFNQWSGYVVGITFGTDATQYKKILYNDATTLYISDANLQPHDPWNNQPFAAIAPYALPVTTAGSQAHFQIISQTYSVDAWTVQPDYRSNYTTNTGGVYLFSGSNSAPFFTLQYYDIIHDSWQTKTCNQALLAATLSTDCTFERMAKTGTAFLSSTATAGAARTLTDSVQTMTVDRYANYRVLITGGTGIGQSRRIICNTATVFTVNKAWDTNPDATSTYEIWGDYDKAFFSGHAGAAMLQYSPSNDFWMQGASFDDGVVANIGVKMSGWEALGVTTGARIAAGVTAVNATPTAGGTGYLVGDILTCSVGGTAARVIVTAIAPTGIVSTIELVAAGTGTGFTTGTGKATTGGTGSGCTIEITSVGATCLVTTASANWFKTGDSVTFSGCSDSAYNVAHTILGAGSTTTFDVATSAAGSMAASNSQSTTVIVDASKSWTTNEHVGKLVHLSVAGTAPTAQIRWITANTATTLTVATIVAGVNGTSKYAIYDSKVFGTDNQFKPANQQNWGHASGGSTTTLIDASKSWVVNAWAGYKLRIESGTGFATGIISITSNTATTLTYTTQGFTPDATTHYEIADSWGLMTAASTTTVTETTTKNWTTNMWAGKRIRITGGTSPGQEVAITSNTATVITMATVTLPDTTSTYAILGAPARGAGTQLIWIWGNSDATTKGRLMLSPRGGASNTFDLYDIPTARWVYGYFISPQAETFTTGSMYAYDGENTVYLQKDATGRVFAYNVSTNAVSALGTIPYGHSTAIIGNRMEIVETTDGLKYLYMMRHTGSEMWRMLIFF
ncbi:MAG: Flagellar hook-length control protein FliK [Parcubacteria bacterium C7867-004]|nr:MAG: Flagellar hook-length control protein FliK [Parcubacteria bacterium C7867-004]